MTTEEFATKHAEADLEDVGDISLPYRVEGAVLMSPGTWNGIRFTKQEMDAAFDRTNWEDDDVRSLFNEHDDQDSRDWIGRVENIRMDGDDLVGDLVIVTEDEARKLAAGAEFGISPKVKGETRGREIMDFVYANFSLVLEPAVQTTFLNSKNMPVGQLIATLQENVAVHEPEFDGTTEGEWDSPDLEDFVEGEDGSWSDLDDDRKSEIGDHFLVSMTGFPAENFGDMKLPVVEPDGDLSIRALRNAKARLGQTQGLNSDHRDRIETIINELAEDNFPDADFEGSEDEEMSDAEEEDQEMSEDNDTTTGNDTMSDAEEEASAEEEEAVEESGFEFDEDALEKVADKVAEKLGGDAEADGDVDGAEAEADADTDADAEAEADEADAEDVGDDVSADVDADATEFSEFYAENDFDSLTEAAEAYEQAQKDPSEKIDEVKQTFEQKLDEIQSELASVKEQADQEPDVDAEMLSQKIGQQRKQAREQVEELSKEDLDAAVWKRMMRIQGHGALVE